MAAKSASPEQIYAALDSLGINPLSIEEIVGRIGGDTTGGLLLYGSRARNDYLPTSDFDILRLSLVGLPTFSAGNVSISSYTPAQLKSATRTLFGTHVQRDGQIILDIDGLLRSIIDSLEPANPAELIEAVKRYSVVLNQPTIERDAHLSGLSRLARYLLRTAVYARSMLQGKLCFSVRELAARLEDPNLATILASNPAITGPPTLQQFEDLVDRLEKEVGPLPENPFPSLQRLAVATWDSDRLVAALALRADDEDAESFDYSDLPKVLL